MNTVSLWPACMTNCWGNCGRTLVGRRSPFDTHRHNLRTSAARPSSGTFSRHLDWRLTKWRTHTFPHRTRFCTLKPVPSLRNLMSTGYPRRLTDYRLGSLRVLPGIRGAYGHQYNLSGSALFRLLPRHLGGDLCGVISFLPPCVVSLASTGERSWDRASRTSELNDLG